MELTGGMVFLQCTGSNSTPEDYVAKERPWLDPTQNQKKDTIGESFLLPNGYPDYIRLILTSRVYDIISETPLTRANVLSNRLNCNVMLKREDLQPTCGFELRGAYNKISHLDPEYRWKGLVACSTGNHAEGVAFSSRCLRIPASIVMPADTSKFKLNNILRLGASVVLSGTDPGAAMDEVQRMGKTYGIANIPSHDDPYVIAGHGTAGIEILRQTNPEHLEAVFCSILDGSLIAGVGVYIKRIAPHVKIIGVGIHDAHSLLHSLVSIRSKIHDNGTIAKEASTETLRLCQEVIDEVEVVAIEETAAAIKEIFEDIRCVTDTNGALAVAGLKQWAERNPYHRCERNLVAITSGVNMDFDSLPFISRFAPLNQDKKTSSFDSSSDRSEAPADLS